MRPHGRVEGSQANTLLIATNQPMRRFLWRAWELPVRRFGGLSKTRMAGSSPATVPNWICQEARAAEPLIAFTAEVSASAGSASWMRRKVASACPTIWSML
jgi:hypothetical protein